MTVSERYFLFFIVMKGTGEPQLANYYPRLRPYDIIYSEMLCPDYGREVTYEEAN